MFKEFFAYPKSNETTNIWSYLMLSVVVLHTYIANIWRQWVVTIDDLNYYFIIQLQRPQAD